MSDTDRDAAPGEDLAAIVLRAGQLGFSTSRVAIALRISPDGLASIQQRIGGPVMPKRPASRPPSAS